MVRLIATAAESPSRNGIETGLAGTEHSRKTIRAAIGDAVSDGLVVVVDGPRNSKLHKIAHPCAECGMPVANKGARHLSCPPDTEIEGLL